MSYGQATRCECGFMMKGELLMEDEFCIRYVCPSCDAEWWLQDFEYIDQLTFDDFIKRKKDERDADNRIALLRLKWKEDKTVKGKVKKWLGGLKRAVNVIAR